MKAPRSLYNLQETFFNAIHENDFQKINEFILEKAPLTKEQRLEIYQTAYVLRMTESLQEDFTRVVQRVGQEKFEEWAQEFLQKNPSTFKNLAEFSEGFPESIKKFSKEAFELAMMDWCEILCAREVQTVDTNQIGLKEIQAGASFKVQKNSVCQILKKEAGDGFIFYRKKDEVFHLEASGPELQLLEFLKVPQDLTVMSLYMLEIGLQQEHGSYLMMEWIQKDILVCLADSN